MYFQFMAISVQMVSVSMCAPDSECTVCNMTVNIYLFFAKPYICKYFHNTFIATSSLWYFYASN